MNPIIRNILAVIVGWLGGSIINMALIKMGHTLIPIEGVDLNDMNSLAEIMPKLEFEFFIFPFLAHALGTLIGATITGFIAASHKMKLSMVIGVFFLLGGISINFILPAPIWFVFIDIIFAYIPMAWLGGKIQEVNKFTEK